VFFTGVRVTIILTPFMYLAGFGLILSLSQHASTLFGLPSPMGAFSQFLNFGIFVIWMPAVLAASSLAKDFKQRDFWKAVLRACPKWMKYSTYFFFGYGVLNFILSVIINPLAGGTPNPDRLSSGHLMAFYSAGMAILYSSVHVREHDEIRRCPMGHHPVPPSARFCEQCGKEIIESGD
jgi:hypothetical protein